jgi:hypothetical protein
MVYDRDRNRNFYNDKTWLDGTITRYGGEEHGMAVFCEGSNGKFQAPLVVGQTIVLDGACSNPVAATEFFIHYLKQSG